MTDPTVARTCQDLTYLAEAWPHLVTLRMPGTARSWVETPRRTGTLSERDLERMGKKGIPRPVPVDVSVLDLLARIATVADDLARTVVDVCGLGSDAVAELVIDWEDQRAVAAARTEAAAAFLPPLAAARDPRPWLRVAGTWLAGAHEADASTAPWVADQLRPLITQAAHMLGDVRHGQVMNGICPWCTGRTTAGTGERTLQIHYPVADDDTDEPLIICHGLNCAPPSGECGQTRGGRPAWPRREWDWLATQLRAPREDNEAERIGA